MNDYTYAYRLLGVAPNCSLQTLKAARRRLIKSWHPDHFPAGSEMRRQAEERIKDINTAFGYLLTYYKEFGALPAPPPNPAKRTSTIAINAHDREFESVPTADRPPPRSRHTSSTARWIVAFAAVCLTIVLTRTALIQKEDTSSTVVLSSHQKAPEPIKPSDSRQPSATASDQYFTIGSTLGEVYAVQGVPTAATAGAWSYGKSTVYFSNGMVTSWEEDPANPLKANMLSVSKSSTRKTFALGSTKKEVRAAEGDPLFETAALWDYGLSKVYFRDDRVVGWESSPLRPLKVRKLDRQIP